MPRKKHYTESIPAGMQFLIDFEDKYKDCWNIIDKFTNCEDTNSRIVHNDLVKYESNSISGILRLKYKTHLMKNEKKIEETFLCLYSWKEHKQLFRFDDIIYNMLIDQAADFENINIPYETLLHPLFPAIYINNPFDNYKGFFVFYDEIFWYDSDIVINFLLVNNIDDTMFISIPLNKNETLLDAVNHTNFSDNASNFDTLKASQLLQIFLYLCSENKDIICKQPSRKSNQKNTYKELSIWEIGFRIGNAIRKNQNNCSIIDNIGNGVDSQIKSLNSNHSRKKAHSRCGHWHHYWKGSKKDNSRNLILKWIAPTFINYNDDILPFVQHNVE